MHIGEKVKQIRLTLGLTQSAFLGVDYSLTYLSRVESGKQKPSQQFLAHLASLHQLSPELLSEDLDSFVLHHIISHFQETLTLTVSDRLTLMLYRKSVENVDLSLQLYSVLLIDATIHKQHGRVKDFYEEMVHRYPIRTYQTTHTPLAPIVWIGLGDAYLANESFVEAWHWYSRAHVEQLAFPRLTAYLCVQRAHVCFVCMPDHPLLNAWIEDSIQRTVATWAPEQRSSQFIFTTLCAIHIHQQLQHGVFRRFAFQQTGLYSLVQESTQREALGALLDEALTHTHIYDLLDHDEVVLAAQFVGVLLQNREIGAASKVLPRLQTAALTTLPKYDDVCVKLTHASLYKLRSDHWNYERLMKETLGELVETSAYGLLSVYALQFARDLSAMRTYKKATNYYEMYIEAKEAQLKLEGSSKFV
ncbi:MAG: helix-turn-helix domain-containing protein [Bacilli bacterium]